MWSVEYVIYCEILHFLFGSLVALVVYFLTSITFLSTSAINSHFQYFGNSTFYLVSHRQMNLLEDRYTVYYWLLLSFSLGILSHIFADIAKLGF